MKILFAPIHYFFDESSHGSDNVLAYEIGTKLASINKGSTIITGTSYEEKNKKYNVIEIYPNRKFFNITILSTIIFNFKCALKTIKELNTQKYDVIHHVFPFNINNTTDLIILFRLNMGIPTIIGPITKPFELDDLDLLATKSSKEYSLNISQLKLRILSPILNFMSKQTMKNATKVIAVNKAAKDAIIKRGIDSKKIVIIPFGVNINNYSFTDFSHKQNDVIKILVVSYLMQRKQIDLILKAIAKVIKSNNNIKLIIVGNGPSEKSLKQLTKKLKIDEYVEFVGYVKHKDITKYYQSSHIYVCMSREEGFATVSLEAMSSGLAVISTKVGGFIDIIKDGENGFLIDIGNYIELANKISLLLQNKNLIATLSKNARTTIKNYYDWDSVIIPQYTNIYSNAKKK